MKSIAKKESSYNKRAGHTNTNTSAKVKFGLQINPNKHTQKT